MKGVLYTIREGLKKLKNKIKQDTLKEVDPSIKKKKKHLVVLFYTANRRSISYQSMIQAKLNVNHLLHPKPSLFSIVKILFFKSKC